MHGLLLACYICIRLSSLSNYIVPENKQDYCNQCTDSLFNVYNVANQLNSNVSNELNKEQLLTAVPTLLSSLEEKFILELSQNFPELKPQEDASNVSEHQQSAETVPNQDISETSLKALQESAEKAIQQKAEEVTLQLQQRHLELSLELQKFATEQREKLRVACASPQQDPPVVTESSHSDTLGCDLRLLTGKFLISKNKQYKATMNKNGLVIVTDTENQIVKKVGNLVNDVKGSGHYLLMQGDGNLVIYNNENEQPTWHSSTYDASFQSCQFTLKLDNFGSLVIYKLDKSIWAVRKEVPEQDYSNPIESTRPDTLECDLKLRTGESLISENRRYKATMNKNGLVIIKDTKKKVIGQVGNLVSDVKSSDYFLVAQGDGNLAIYDNKNLQPTWATGNYESGFSGCKYTLQLDNDGKLVMYRLSNAFWDSQRGIYSEY